ncbi:hypothetical protein BDV36DRAFT_246821 [Aspergillus pseudocaelatus]|uniref:Uncharacterized protein n=1 Tax=Aspergillus pseudocaelatus TaxID=1825620 RepID=A0ABQ6WZQ3_9EURO|nr:hypothetical protein BDV36DRAFT_246821 [Aspergillus pseudocaelatus]
MGVVAAFEPAALGCLSLSYHSLIADEHAPTCRRLSDLDSLWLLRFMEESDARGAFSFFVANAQVLNSSTVLSRAVHLSFLFVIAHQRRRFRLLSELRYVCT